MLAQLVKERFSFTRSSLIYYDERVRCRRRSFLGVVSTFLLVGQRGGKAMKWQCVEKIRNANELPSNTKF